jgi:hypothetical protein
VAVPAVQETVISLETAEDQVEVVAVMILILLVVLAQLAKAIMEVKVMVPEQQHQSAAAEVVPEQLVVLVLA